LQFISGEHTPIQYQVQLISIFLPPVIFITSRPLAVRSIAMSLSLRLSVCPLPHFNKTTAVAEIGDRLATVDMGRKVGAAVPLSFFWGGGSWVPI